VQLHEETRPTNVESRSNIVPPTVLETSDTVVEAVVSRKNRRARGGLFRPSRLGMLPCGDGLGRLRDKAFGVTNVVSCPKKEQTGRLVGRPVRPVWV